MAKEVNSGITLKYWWVGFPVALAFLFINKISPALSIGVPSLPLALSSQVRYVILIVIAPIIQEAVFRKIILERLMNKYGMNFAKANVYQAAGFSVYHFLSYGIVLKYIESVSQLVGTFGAVSGLFITAFAYGLVAGYVKNKTNNLLPGIIAHSLINSFLATAGFVIAFCIILIKNKVVKRFE